MTTHHISGRTWDHRALFREWDGRWDNTNQRWEISGLTDVHLARLATMPGVMVTEVAPRATAIRTDPIIIGDDETHYNRFVDKDPIVFFGFSSLAKFCDYVESLDRPPNTGGTCDIGWSTNEERRYVCATENMQEALGLARNGWIDAFGMHRAMLTPRPISTKRAHGIAGGSVNVGRMLAGNPVHMRKRAKAPGRKTITLFVQCTMWYKTSPKVATMRALLIGSIVDLLEQEGYICNIYAVCTSARGWLRNHGKQLCVNVKEAGQRLNLLDIMFAFGHPSFSRRLFFAAEGSIPECRMTYEDRGVIRPAFDDDNPTGQNEFYIPFLDMVESTRCEKLANPVDMLQYIEPVGLPISLKDRL